MFAPPVIILTAVVGVPLIQSGIPIKTAVGIIEKIAADQRDLANVGKANDIFDFSFGPGENGQKQGRQDHDDGNDHEQLDERKSKRDAS